MCVCMYVCMYVCIIDELMNFDSILAPFPISLAVTNCEGQ